ncbi:MAG TPA: hypothetical protein VFC19_38830 [Candidatus Limnocylindrales bacterium]|nr:hypothetical protein [Candidatus Limnocylindrales bacterium]
MSTFYCEHSTSKSRVLALVEMPGMVPALRAVFSCADRAVAELAAEILGSIAVHGLGPNVQAVVERIKSLLPQAPAASFRDAVDSAVAGKWEAPQDIAVHRDEVWTLYGYEQSDHEPVTPALRDSLLRGSSNSRLADYAGTVIRHIQLTEFHTYDPSRLVAAATATGWKQREEPGFEPQDSDNVLDSVMWFFDQGQAVPGTDIVTQTSEAQILAVESGDEVHDWSPEPVVADFGRGWLLLPGADGDLDVENARRPDFAGLFPLDQEQLNNDEEDEDGWRLTPRTADAIYTALCVLADEAYDDVEEHQDAPVDPSDDWMVFDRLPRITWRMEAAWRRQFARAADDLSYDLERGKWPLPTCTAEEMCLHLAIEDAGALTESHRHQMLPEHDDDYAWDLCSELFFQDHDVLMLFDPRFDGIEDPENEINQRLGIANLRSADWFQPFNNREARDPDRRFRR